MEGGGGRGPRALISLLCVLDRQHAPPHPQWFCAGERLDRTVQRALQAGGDELAFKLLRNLAAAGGAKLAARLAPWVPQLVTLLQARAGGASW